jgi:hypothetical protein
MNFLPARVHRTVWALVALVVAQAVGVVPGVFQVGDAYAASAIEVAPTTVAFGNVTVGQNASSR